MNKLDTTENNAVPLRARLRQARIEIPESERSRGSLLMRGRLFTWLNVAREEATKQGKPAPTTIAAFWPLEYEPDLRPLLQQWTQAGITVALPVIEKEEAPLLFRTWMPGDELVTGPFNVKEPHAEKPLVRPDVVLVPTLGYTVAADRIGYGGGYYDRTLSALRKANQDLIAIGIAWDEGLLEDDYYPAPHDERLDAILTPGQWIPEPPALAPGAPNGSVIRSYIFN